MRGELQSFVTDSMLEPLWAAASTLMAWQVAWALGAAALAYLVLGLTGFGSALIVVPLLAWHWPLALVVPLVLMIDLPTSLLHTWLNRRQVQWHVLGHLLPGMALGALLGDALSNTLSQGWALGALGIYVVSIGVRGWRHQARSAATPPPPPAKPVSGSMAWLRDTATGLAVGVVETFFGTAGPIVVAFLSQRLPDVARVRANTPPVLILAVGFALGSFAMRGHLFQALIGLAYVPMVVVALAAVAWGHHLAVRLQGAMLARLVFALLVASGLALTARAIRML